LGQPEVGEPENDLSFLMLSGGRGRYSQSHG
jgi:hypothetical protein